MKLFSIVLLLSFSVPGFAAITKETWTCKMDGETTFKAVFTATTTNALLITANEEVVLTFKNSTQKTALNRSMKTELKGEYHGWDHIDYKLTLIRNKPEDFAAQGRLQDTADGQVLLVTDGDYDCAGRRVSAQTIECVVEIVR